MRENKQKKEKDRDVSQTIVCVSEYYRFFVWFPLCAAIRPHGFEKLREPSTLAVPWENSRLDSARPFRSLGQRACGSFPSFPLFRSNRNERRASDRTIRAHEAACCVTHPLDDSRPFFGRALARRLLFALIFASLILDLLTDRVVHVESQHRPTVGCAAECARHNARL